MHRYRFLGIALIIILMGLAMSPIVASSVEKFNWQRYATAYEPCTPNMIFSGQSEQTMGDLDDLYDYGGQTFAYVYIYGYSDDNDSLNALVSGYDPGSGTWEVIAQQSYGGSGVIADQYLIPPTYTQLRVELDDTENNDLIYYDYEFMVCRERVVSLDPATRQQFAQPASTTVFSETVTNYTMGPDSFYLSVLGNNWPTTFWHGGAQITHTGLLTDLESFGVAVHVEVPAGAIPGDADIATIRASSVSSPTISDTATITTAIIGDLAYVTLRDSNQVVLIDTASHVVAGTVDMAAWGCTEPWRAAISPTGDEVYVSCRGSASVAVIETTGNTVIANVGGINGASGIAFTQDGTYALVGSRFSSQIAILDTSAHATTGFIATPHFPRSIAVHPFLDRAYATCDDGSVLVIDTSTFSIDATIPTGGNLMWDVAASPDGQWVFASHRNGAGLAVIDANSNSLYTTVTGLGDLEGLEVAPDGSEIYAASQYNGLHVIDGTSFTHLTTITGLGSPWEAAVTCDGSELYVGNKGDWTPVIETAGHTLAHSIPLPGSGARGIAVCPQRVVPGVYLRPLAQTNAGGRGEMVAHQESVFNATGASESFTLTLGSHAWESSLSHESLGPIPHGGSMTFTVYVTVPLGVDWYSTDGVTVTAVSVTSPTIYSDTARLTTEAYAPPEISISPDSISTTLFITETSAHSLTISNGDGVTLGFSIAAGPGVSFLAVSTELYGYDVPYALLRIIGTQDDSYVQVLNLQTGAVIDVNTDLDRYEIWDVYPSDGTYFKIEADKPVVGYESSLNDHTTFIPSLETGPVGREFIFYYVRSDGFFVFAIEDTSVEVYNSSGSLVASQTLAAGEYWDLSLPHEVYHVISTGDIAMETVGENGYTTVPSSTGNGVGHRFYFGTYSWQTGAFVVFAYQDVDVDVYDMDSGSQLYSQHIDRGTYWWQTGVGTHRLRLESSGKVEVWAGDTEGGLGIEDLGDDISFAAGDRSQNYYLHSLEDGSVIFGLEDNTRVDVDGAVYYLDKDEYLHLTGCCYFRQIQSNQPILIQTLGRDTSWNDMGSYLGGISTASGSFPAWLAVEPVSGTVPTESSTLVQVTLDPTGLQPDTYRYDLIVRSNDPVSSAIPVPVTMTVLPTADMGQVTGSVSDLWTGLPLNATVELAGVYSMTAEPDYTIWAPAGSYSLLAYAPHYMTATHTITITAGGVVTQDMALEPAEPRLAWFPDPIEARALQGTLVTRTLFLSNTGPVPLDFTLYEISPTLAMRGATPADLMGVAVLYDRAHGQSGTWDYTTLIADLISAGATITENYTIPIDQTVLEGVDILWTNYGNTAWGYDELGALDTWLDEGGAILVHGDQSAATSGPASIFGISYQSGSCGSGVTANIEEHPISDGVDTLNVEYRCWHVVPGSGTEIVAYDTYSQPHVVAQAEGGGKIVVVDSNDFLDGYIDYEDNRLLANNSVAWLARPPYTDVPWLSETPATGTIPGHSSQPVTLGFGAQALPLGEYQALLAIEHNAPSQPIIDLPVTLTVLEDLVQVSLTPPWQEKDRLPGGTAVYSFTVTNEGTLSDTYSLVASGVWTPTLSADLIGPLEPGESDRFYLAVTIPLTATEGMSDIATITARSTFDPMVSADARARTRVPPISALYLPVILKYGN